MRPTPEEVRGRAVALVEGDFRGKRVLDLFAGTGALGLEALSRGAISADFVENGPAALHALKVNVAALRETKRCRIFKKDAIPWVESLERGSYAVAFADPPYGSAKLDRVVARWREVPFADLLKRAELRMSSGDGRSGATFSLTGEVKSKFSLNSFGAHFVEITWQPEIARLRVSRVVTVMDAGRIINTLAGRNQIEGGVLMGIGMALMEHTSYDTRTGAPINSNFADYVVPVNADVPSLEVHFLDYPDKEANPLGARGIGEIGLAGVAAAITEAVHHATGVRVRELPVKIENLLT